MRNSSRQLVPPFPTKARPDSVGYSTLERQRAQAVEVQCGRKQHPHSAVNACAASLGTQLAIRPPLGLRASTRACSGILQVVGPRPWSRISAHGKVLQVPLSISMGMIKANRGGAGKLKPLLAVTTAYKRNRINMPNSIRGATMVASSTTDHRQVVMLYKSKRL